MTRFVPTRERDAVMIGPRCVGRGHPAFVIAEAGVNHDGSLDKALRLVDAAVAAGADAVKFQVFRAMDLAIAAAPLAFYQQGAGAGSQQELLARLELADEDLVRLQDHCRARRIEFLATPFSPRDLERLLRLGVAAVKIASTDLTNLPLLQAAAECGRPLLVSTGASTAEEIADSVRRLRQLRATERTILLHCVSSYPTPLTAANLRAIAAKATRFDLPVGFSDHTLEVETGAWAVAAGACALEKHLTLDRSAAGPDHAMSLCPAELKAYIEAVRRLETALGDGLIRVHPLEEQVRSVARRSVVVERALPAGATLTAEALKLKRPGGGITPQELPAVLGRRLRQPIAADTMLTWDMLEPLPKSPGERLAVPPVTVLR